MLAIMPGVVFTKGNRLHAAEVDFSRDPPNPKCDFRLSSVEPSAFSCGFAAFFLSSFFSFLAAAFCMSCSNTRKLLDVSLVCHAKGVICELTLPPRPDPFERRAAVLPSRSWHAPSLSFSPVELFDHQGRHHRRPEGLTESRTCCPSKRPPESSQ